VSCSEPPALPDGPTARTLGPIEGTDRDPPDVDAPLIAWAVRRHDLAAWCWRWWERFRDGRGTLSAKGIAFYSFFGVISGLLLAFIVAAQLPQYEQLLITIVSEALPGLFDPSTVDEQGLQTVAGRLGILGAVVLLYSALGIVRAIDDGLRLIYGVQYQPRLFVAKTVRYLGFLLLLTPLVALSYVASSASAGLFGPLLRALGLPPWITEVVVTAAGTVGAVALNTVTVWVLLGHLGGITPHRWVWRGALLGGAALSVVQWGTTVLVSVTLANPRWVSFGAPVAMLLLFYLMALTVLAAAAFVATANEDDPLQAARRQQEREPGRLAERAARLAESVLAVSGRPRRDSTDQ
jgi:membrane protein